MIAECKRLVLERYMAGEIEETERREARRHIDSCSACSSLVAQLASERTEFLEHHPFSSFAGALDQVDKLTWYRSLLITLGKPVFVPVYGIVLLLLFVVPLQFTGKRFHVAFKGAPALSFYYQRGEIMREGFANQRFRANDRIQVAYSLTRSCYVALISVDSRGIVSFYHPEPEATTCSVSSKAGNHLFFPGSVILDATQGDELVIALFSDNALQTRDVASWIKGQFSTYPDPGRIQHHLGAEAHALGAETATLLLRKE